MSEADFYPVVPPLVGGKIGTGPVDLQLASQSVMPPYEIAINAAGSGEIFNRAFQWFTDAAQAATSESDRIEHSVGAARTANNSALWVLKYSDDPRRLQVAFDALRVAEDITDYLGSDAPKDVRHAVLANLGGVLSLAGHPNESRRYLLMAQSLRESIA